MGYGLEIKGVVPLFAEYRFEEPVGWKIAEGEQWAIAGPNGAGKSLLTDILQGKVARKEGTIAASSTGKPPAPGDIRSMQFRDIYSLVDCRNVYYQQRWNSSDLAESPPAGALFEGLSADMVNRYLDMFSLRHILGKRMISLSSGELRKALIVRTLARQPRLLILDNPFIGLDEASRSSLGDMLGQMAGTGGMQTILAVADPAEIPQWIDKVLPVKEKTLLPPVRLAEFLDNTALQSALFPETSDAGLALPAQADPTAAYRIVLRMDQVTVKYGGNLILDKIDWEVRRGERWALLGENGAGKSTLLSLVNADNPQAYANRITLFDRRRGDGESIWEIKRRIGYLNSDLHAYYLQDIAALEVVVSGFFDSIGLSRNGTRQQYERARQWLAVFGAAHLAERSFVKLSFGQQRIVLLARTFVKHPEVLILDEPLHGLDAGKKALVKRVVEQYCQDPDKTLIYVTHYRGEIPSAVTLTKTLSRPIQRG